MNRPTLTALPNDRLTDLLRVRYDDAIAEGMTAQEAIDILPRRICIKLHSGITGVCTPLLSEDQVSRVETMVRTRLAMLLDAAAKDDRYFDKELERLSAFAETEVDYA